jgi:cellulose synthase/poly-beta-1,6-N-acetylglucosamine synthase-like glycosyltransferase
MTSVWLWTFWTSLALVGYAQAGYPLLALLASRRRGQRRDADFVPSVTLIVPAYNEEKVLAAKLDNCLAIDYPSDRIEIVVASDGSSDATCEIARRYADRGVRLLAFPRRRGKASVLNDAVAAAAGDVLCLCDANVMFRPDALGRLVGWLADERIGAACGDVRLASDESDFGKGEGLYYQIERGIQVGESRIGSIMGVDGGMYVVRKELYRTLPPDTILDDFVISIDVVRVGRRVLYDPEAIATENGTPSSRQEFRRRVRVAAGAVQSLKRGNFPPPWMPVEFWQFLSHKLLRWLGPIALAAALAANVALCTTSAFYAWLLGLQAACWLAALAGAVSTRFRATRLGGVVFYFALSQAAIGVGLVKGVFNRQKVTWTKADRGGPRLEATSA